MKKIILFLVTIALIASYSLTAQVAINSDGSSPDASAMLDIQCSDNGILIPRMTSVQRDAISSPANGLFIFNADNLGLEVYTIRGWQAFEKVSCAPDQPGSITGEQYPDCNETGLVYSISAVTDATTYAWAVPTGATISNGQGSTSITVDFASQGGDVSVVASSGCGNSDARNLSVSISIPAKPSGISGPAQVNSGSTHTYTITAVNGSTSYHWTVPGGAVIQSGQNTTSIEVKFSFASGNISVRSQNNCGNSDYTDLPVIVVF